MRFKTITLFSILIVSVWGSAVPGLAQETPFWSEDFSNGIPASWTNEDESGNGILWTWCGEVLAESLGLWHSPPEFGSRPTVGEAA